MKALNMGFKKMLGTKQIITRQKNKETKQIKSEKILPTYSQKNNFKDIFREFKPRTT